MLLVVLLQVRVVHHLQRHLRLHGRLWGQLAHHIIEGLELGGVRLQDLGMHQLLLLRHQLTIFVRLPEADYRRSRLVIIRGELLLLVRVQVFRVLRLVHHHVGLVLGRRILHVPCLGSLTRPVHFHQACLGRRLSLLVNSLLGAPARTARM